MAICFIAVVFITTSGEKDPAAVAEEEANLSDVNRTLGMIIILCGAWIFATANILNRVLKDLHHA
jgi:hypothetical protein